MTWLSPLLWLCLRLWLWDVALALLRCYSCELVLPFYYCCLCNCRSAHGALQVFISQS